MRATTPVLLARWAALLALVLGAAFTVRLPVAGADGGDGADDPNAIPGKIYKLLEMDQIPAIKRPKFVSADEAAIPDGHRMIGVVIDGDARAYCPNILNHHEIVNDEVGGRKIAVTW